MSTIKTHSLPARFRGVTVTVAFGPTSKATNTLHRPDIDGRPDFGVAVWEYVRGVLSRHFYADDRDAFDWEFAETATRDQAEEAMATAWEYAEGLVWSNEWLGATLAEDDVTLTLTFETVR